MLEELLTHPYHKTSVLERVIIRKDISDHMNDSMNLGHMFSVESTILNAMIAH
jgi:hypothetical protein